MTNASAYTAPARPTLGGLRRLNAVPDQLVRLRVGPLVAVSALAWQVLAGTLQPV